MKKSTSFRRRLITGISIFLFILSILVAGVYYIVTYRLKNSLQYAVNQASEGKYAFDAEKVSLSLWRKTFFLKNARLTCQDTGHLNSHYTVSLKEIYFSVSSLRDILMDKKILIDSLSVIEPDISVHVHQVKISDQHKTAFHTSNILNYLQMILKRFNARSLTVKDAAITYGLRNGPPPFHAEHINIAFYNFSRVTESDAHILGSDNVTFSMGRQYWILPDGHNRISFKGLSFNGIGQRFELDSCTFYRNSLSGEGETIIHSDRFYFSARHLPAIYMRNELLIDSLVCINPVIELPAPGKEKHKMADSLSVDDYIFNRINVKYIDVKNGDVVLKTKNGLGQNASSHKTNLSIYNLTLDPALQHPLSTDSIRADLSRITFVSPDSLYQLGIDNFAFRNNNVLFRNVVFEPTPYKDAKRSIRFEAPSLLVRDISLEDLLRRRIRATDAELLNPLITFVSKRKRKSKKAATPAMAASGSKMDLFYQSLHGLKDLIDVRTFKVINGSMSYTTTGMQPSTLSVRALNADILLNKLFVSDSLMDIKHAMPDLRFGIADIKTPKMHIELDNYRFDGILRHNLGGNLRISLANGTVLKGKNIYWEEFDWDVFQATRDIQIDLLQIGQLDVTSTSDNYPPSKQAAVKDLPVIRVGRLKAGKVSYAGEGNTSVHFSAKDFHANNVRSLRNLFIWDSSTAIIYNISFRSKKMQASVKEVYFNNHAVSDLTGIQVESDQENGHTSISIPVIRLQTDLHSTDFSILNMPSIEFGEPVITILSHKTPPSHTIKKQQPETPLNLNTAHIVVRTGSINYTQISGTDTLRSKALADLDIYDLKISGNAASMISLAALNLNLTVATLSKKNLSVDIPHASFALKDVKASRHNGVPGFSAAAEFAWQKALVHYYKDSTDLNVRNLSGSFRDNFAYSPHPKKNFSWQTLINKVAVAEGTIHYKGKKITASAENYSWNPQLNQMQVHGFSMVPVMSREETFRTAPWQEDYITVKGDLLAINGLRIGHTADDSLLHAGSITAKNVVLNTSRDKRMPFRHGTEKLMPTKLIRTIHIPLLVDTIVLNHNDVTYHELSIATGKWSDVLLKDINGYISNFSNRAGNNDSLKIYATAALLDNHIRQFTYSESYHDSLSSFRAQSHLAPLQLTRFSDISIPMAAVSITAGQADTVYAFWEGNKHAAYGSMNFYYHDLKIKIHDKNGNRKTGFMSSLETFAVNLILPNKKRRPSAIFVERDKEKFVFNYWVKTQAKGILTTVGVKKSRKYRKQYKQKQQKYSLPVKTNKELKNLSTR